MEICKYVYIYIGCGSKKQNHSIQFSKKQVNMNIYNIRFVYYLYVNIYLYTFASKVGNVSTSISSRYQFFGTQLHLLLQGFRRTSGGNKPFASDGVYIWIKVKVWAFKSQIVVLVLLVGGVVLYVFIYIIYISYIYNIYNISISIYIYTMTPILERQNAIDFHHAFCTPWELPMPLHPGLDGKWWQSWRS